MCFMHSLFLLCKLDASYVLYNWDCFFSYFYSTFSWAYSWELVLAFCLRLFMILLLLHLICLGPTYQTKCIPSFIFCLLSADSTLHGSWNLSVDGWVQCCIVVFDLLISAPYMRSFMLIYFWKHCEWCFYARLSGKEHALVISNHRSDIDWLVGWVLAQVCVVSVALPCSLCFHC